MKLSSKESPPKSSCMKNYLKRQNCHPILEPTSQDNSIVGSEGFGAHKLFESAIQQSLDMEHGLDETIQVQMGSALGHDFSRVKVHTGPVAKVLNQRLGSSAFTIGSDIFFSQNAYNPNTRQGRKLIAHELVHVVQQSEVHGCNPPEGVMATPVDDAYEHEAETLAEVIAQKDGRHDRSIKVRLRTDRYVVQRALETRVDRIPGFGGAGIPGLCHNGTVAWLYEEAHGVLPDIKTVADLEPTRAILGIIREGKNVSRGSSFIPGDVLIWVTGSGQPGHSCIVLAGAKKIGGYNNAGWFDPSIIQPAQFSQENVSSIRWTGSSRATAGNQQEYKLVKVPAHKAVARFDTRQ